MPPFSHINDEGNPAMVDVSAKSTSLRTAKARAVVVLPDAVWTQLEKQSWQSAKGGIFQTAILAGVMAAKKTGELIPLCHPLPLDHCGIDIEVHQAGEIRITCSARVGAKTGVEMEALTGATLAALTVYDMCKALAPDIVIREIRLLEKTGGKKDYRFEP
jgi:cyclic pyranopterin phosphate synthase